MQISIERLQQGESIKIQDVKTKLFWEFDEYTQAPKPYKTYAQSSRQTTSTRSHVNTKNKGKEIVKPPSPPSESASEDEIYDQRAGTVAENMETIGNQVVKQSGIHCYNCKGSRPFARKLPALVHSFRSFYKVKGVVGPEHEGLPWMLDDPYVQVALQAPPSPDYIPGPEEPQSPPLPDFVPEPIYPEYMPQEDEVFPAEEQPLPAAASPTAQSPDYVSESDPEADPEEDDDEDPEEDLVDYPAGRGDDGDDEDESSEDDEDDDEVDIEADDDEEEEEHPAPADSVVVALPAVDHAPFAEETEPFESDESAATPPPHPTYRVTARISITALVPTPIWSDAEVSRILAISTPPSSALSPWSSLLPYIPSPPLPLIPSPSLPVSPPASPIRSLGYRAAMIRLRAKATSTSHSLPLLPPIILSHTRPASPSSGTPPLHLLSTNRREDRPEVTLPPQTRLGIALGPRYEVGESSSAAARPAGDLRAEYSFVATMDREIRRDPERDVGYRITNSWDKI
ncbi:hypothetical protein Tco_1473842, partial [Tanacetum coccineum]